MTLQFADRVMETFTTTGTGTISLAGAVTGYQAFSAVCSNGDTAYYAASDASGNWEVGLGTYTTSGDTLARTTIIASSNSNAAVSWAAGSKTIWLNCPASLFSSGVLGSSEVLLGTQVASNSSAINFINLPSTYDHLIVRLTNIIPSTNNANLLSFFSTNNGSSYDNSNNYYVAYNYVQFNNATGVGGGQSTAYRYMDSVDTYGVSGVITYMGLNSTNASKFAVHSMMRSQSGQAETGGMVYGNSSVVNAFSIQCSTGTIASGDVSVYGVRKS